MEEKQNRKKRYRGESFINRSGKMIEAKVFLNSDCKCSKNCFQNVNPGEREKLFRSFLALADNVKQNIYIRGLVQRSEVRQR